MIEQATPYTVSLALDAALVRDAEAAVERLNRDRDGDRPIGLGDLVAAALVAALGGPCGCEREDLDAEDAAWVAGYFRSGVRA